jgi:hypothetical protein
MFSLEFFGTPAGDVEFGVATTTSCHGEGGVITHLYPPLLKIINTFN